MNTVTISNMSVDSNPVERDGKRGRYREITVNSSPGVSDVNPDEWPHVDLKPSKEGSAKRQRHVGLGGEKIDNLREWTVKVCTKQYGGGDISSRVTFQGSKGRKPLLAVLGEIDKGNTGSSMGVDPFYCQAIVLVWLL